MLKKIMKIRFIICMLLLSCFIASEVNTIRVQATGIQPIVETMGFVALPVAYEVLIAILCTVCGFIVVNKNEIKQIAWQFYSFVDDVIKQEIYMLKEGILGYVKYSNALFKAFKEFLKAKTNWGKEGTTVESIESGAVATGITMPVVKNVTMFQQVGLAEVLTEWGLQRISSFGEKYMMIETYMYYASNKVRMMKVFVDIPETIKQMYISPEDSYAVKFVHENKDVEKILISNDNTLLYDCSTTPISGVKYHSYGSIKDYNGYNVSSSYSNDTGDLKNDGKSYVKLKSFNKTQTNCKVRVYGDIDLFSSYDKYLMNEIDLSNYDTPIATNKVIPEYVNEKTAIKDNTVAIPVNGVDEILARLENVITKEDLEIALSEYAITVDDVIGEETDIEDDKEETLPITPDFLDGITKKLDDVVEGIGGTDVTITSEDKGLGIIGWLKKIWESILDIPTNIVTWLQKIWQAILDIPLDIISFFAIDWTEVQGELEPLTAKFKNKFSAIIAVVTMFKDLSINDNDTMLLVKMDTPRFLLDLSNTFPKELIVLDLTPYKTQVTVIKNALRAFMWLVFGLSLINAIKVRLNID